MISAFLIGAAIGFVFAIVFLIWQALQGHSIRKQRRANGYPDDNSDLSPWTKLMLGTMGAKLLDNQIEKHKQESERKWQDTLNWQDSARNKDQDDYHPF